MKQQTAAQWQDTKKRYEQAMRIVGDMHRAGVPLLAGTDIMNPFLVPGFSLHDELALLVAAGLTPMEALQTATRNAAQYLEILDSYGTVEKGKIADLVVLDADPLADIRNTQKISGVVTGGRYFARPALDKMLADVEILANPK
jgi:imidazolonepropionase-like amidohydrolase